MATTDLEKGRDRFEAMTKACYSVMTVEYLANGIRELVRLGKTTWEELGFTDNDIEERIRLAKIRIAKENFSKMSDACYSDQMVQAFAGEIRHLVRTGQATWEELGCTGAEVGKRLAAAQKRWAKR